MNECKPLGTDTDERALSTSCLLELVTGVVDGSGSLEQLAELGELAFARRSAPNRKATAFCEMEDCEAVCEMRLSPEGEPAPTAENITPLASFCMLEMIATEE